MSKKSLKGLVKTHHFKQRQRERRVSDQDILKALTFGEFVENDHGQNFVLGKLKVTVDYDQEVLITVHPGDPSSRTVKILSIEEGKKIREHIEKHKSKNQEPDDDFLKYVTENRVKKVKKD